MTTGRHHTCALMATGGVSCYAAASTAQVEDGWTFRELVYDFAFGDNIYSSIGSGTRSGLAAVNERIEALGRILGGVSLLWPLMLRSWRAAQ